MKEKQSISKGEQLVRVSFNPGKNQDVDDIKKRAAELIDMILLTGNDDRCTQLAINAIENGAMWAVKSVTFNS